MTGAPRAYPLPPLLSQIADQIGEEAAVNLAIAFGGQRLRIPKRINSEHKICSVLGLPAAQQLSRACGGDEINVPKANAACAMYLDNRGFDRAEIGRRLRIDRSAVYKLLSKMNGAKDEIPQLSLFAD